MTDLSFEYILLTYRGVYIHINVCLEPPPIDMRIVRVTFDLDEITDQMSYDVITGKIDDPYDLLSDFEHVLYSARVIIDKMFGETRS